MSTGLLLLFCLAGRVFAEEPPDVDCLVVHLKYVHCSWNKLGTPEVNYTFYGWFHNDKVISECPTYLSENNTNTGCNQPYGNAVNRFSTFYTKLVHDKQSFQEEHYLKAKVKLNPPTNMTVQHSNLLLTWTQTFSQCVESEVRYRINNRKWATSHVSTGSQNYLISLHPCNSLVEMQVRSKLGYSCGESSFWSDWSESVVWGSNNSTGFPKILNSSQCEVQSEVLICVCISEGFPLPTIKWLLSENHAKYSVTTTVSNHTVNSTITLTEKDHSSTVIECVSSNEVGEVQQNVTIITSERQEDQHGPCAVLLWVVIAVVSLIVNVICIILLMVLWNTRQNVKPNQEDRTYMSLKDTYQSPEYDVIAQPLK